MRHPLSRRRTSRVRRRGRLVGASIAIAGLVAATGQAPVGSALAAVAAGASPVVHFHPGSEDLHDPLVPGLGNGGYEVSHYGIVLDYDLASGVLTGTTTVSARLTQNLSQFNLDFALPVQSVTVNGAVATFPMVLHRGAFPDGA